MNYEDILNNAAEIQAKTARMRADLIADLEAQKADWLATDPQKAPAGRASSLRYLNRELRRLRALSGRS